MWCFAWQNSVVEEKTRNASARGLRTSSTVRSITGLSAQMLETCSICASSCCTYGFSSDRVGLQIQFTGKVAYAAPKELVRLAELCPGQDFGDMVFNVSLVGDHLKYTICCS